MKNKSGLIFIGIGIELAILMVGGLLIGQKIDEYYQTKGLWVAVLPLIVLVGWVFHLIVLLRKYEKDLKK